MFLAKVNATFAKVMAKIRMSLVMELAKISEDSSVAIV